MCCADSHGFLSSPTSSLRRAFLLSNPTGPSGSAKGTPFHRTSLFASFTTLHPHESTNGGQTQWRPFYNRGDLRNTTVLIKLAIRELEMSGHYFVRRSIITRIR